MKAFRTVRPQDLRDNAFTAIGKEWMLVTAGSLRRYNMMTASWGAFGVLWHRNVCFCFVRPGRHTFGFLEAADRFTLSFFGSGHRKVLNFCGSRSGRDVDKMRVAGLTPVSGGRGVVYFQEARLVVVARKIYHQDIIPGNFLDPRIEENYPKKDYHRMYVGEVVRCLKK